MALRLALCVALAVVSIGTPAFARGEKKRHAKQGEPALKTPSTGEQREETKDKRRDGQQPEETADERRRRWERGLRSKDRDQVLAVFGELHRAETAEARDLLTAYVKAARDDRMKERAILALGWRGNRGALQLLSGKHGASSSRGRIAAAGCRAIGAVGDAAKRPFLVERLASDDAETAAGALAGIIALDPRSPALPDLLRRGATHTEPEVRSEVATALATVRVDDWRDRLGLLAVDASADVRVAACDALAARADEATAPLLLRLQSDDPSEDVRAAALRALIAIEEALTAE